MKQSRKRIGIPDLRELNQEINQIIHQKGGLLDPFQMLDPDDLFLNLYKRFYFKSRFCISNLYTDKPREIHFGFVLSAGMNAFAYSSPDGDFDFVGINSGAVFTLSDIFCRLLSHSSFLPDVGNPNLENDDRSITTYLSSNVLESAVKPGFIIPNCDIRNAYAGFMLQSALDFLFFHEITHLRNGHLEWKRDRQSVIFYEEAISHCRLPDGLTSQAFEMDADSGAILCTINQGYETLYRIEDMINSKHYDAIVSAFGTPEKLIRMIFISVYILFRLFNINRVDFLNQDSLSHPQPPIRQIWIAETLFTLFDNRPNYKYDANQFRDHVSKFIVESEAIVASIINDEIDIRGISSVIESNHTNDHLMRVKARWSELRPQLEAFKRGGKLAE